MQKLNCEIDAGRKTAEFGRLMKKALVKYRMSLKKLSTLTDIPVKRIKILMEAKDTITVVELQLLSMALGIGMDKLFSIDNFSDKDIRPIFKNLTSGNNMGLIAAAPALNAESVTDEQDMEEIQVNYERSIVQLHYCTECLGQFPYGEL